jgi:hypothetical protein
MAEVGVDVNDSKLNIRLDALAPAVHDALVVAVTLDSGELLGRVQEYASQMFQVRTGRFVNSFKVGLRQSKNHVTGRVYSRDPRASLFEWGGTTPPHDIAPKTAQALLLQVRGGQKFAAVVHHPGGKYRRTEILHTAFDDMKSQIRGDLDAAVKGAIPPP